MLLCGLDFWCDAHKLEGPVDVQRPSRRYIYVLILHCRFATKPHVTVHRDNDKGVLCKAGDLRVTRGVIL